MIARSANGLISSSPTNPPTPVWIFPRKITDNALVVVRCVVHGTADVGAALHGHGDQKYLDFGVAEWWRTTD